MYDSNKKVLYLKYDMGICSVDADDSINRYVKSDTQYSIQSSFIETAKKNNKENTLYMTAEQFKQIINNIK